MSSLRQREKEELARKRREQEADERAEAARRKRAEQARNRRARDKYSAEFFARQEAEARGEIYVKKETRGRKRKYPLPKTPEAVSISRNKCQTTRIDMDSEPKPALPSKFAERYPEIQPKSFDLGNSDVSCTNKRPKASQECRIGPTEDLLTSDRHCTKCNAIYKKLASSKYAGNKCDICGHQFELPDQSDGNFRRCTTRGPL